MTTTPNDGLTLKKIIGAMLFAAKKQVSAGDLKKIFIQTAEQEEAPLCREFSKIKESEINGALEQIKIDLIQADAGINISEVAGGFRLQTDPACGPWLRQLLSSGRPSRLSKPTLETLAIIAYRQPVTRSEIESVRGVNVDNIVRHLLECQLIKISGRSDLPGHPLLYGTTHLFLEHFGLQDINHLPGIEQLRRREAERIKARTAQNMSEKSEDAEIEDEDDDTDEAEEDNESPSAGPETETRDSDQPQKNAETTSPG